MMDVEPGIVALHQALNDEDAERVKELLEMGVRPDAPKGMLSSLGAATMANSVEICRILLDAGANVDFGGRCGRCPLYIAAKADNIELVKLFIDRGANLDLKWMNGNTALLEATLKGSCDVVTLLMKAGSNPFVTNNGGDTGLHLAAARGNENILMEYLAAGLDVNVIKFQGPKNVSNTGIRPLHMAAFGPNGGHPHIARILINRGADIDAVMDTGRTALHICAMRNAIHVADVLLQNGCQVDPTSEEPEEDKTPLLKAVDSGRFEMVTKLIYAGADLNCGDKWGCTALFTAIFHNKVLIAKELIQGGADVNLCTKNGMSPLKASLRHPPHMTQMLVLAGCHLDTTTRIMFEDPSDNMLLMFHKEWTWVISQNENGPVKSLQQICREVIRCALGQGLVKKSRTLPVAPRLKDYIAMKELDPLVNMYSYYDK